MALKIICLLHRIQKILSAISLLRDDHFDVYIIVFERELVHELGETVVRRAMVNHISRYHNVNLFAQQPVIRLLLRPVHK